MSQKSAKAFVFPERAVAPIPAITPYVASRAELAALPTSNLAAYLLEAGRQGMFQWNAANLQAQVTVDTQQGVYVPPTGQDGVAGAWVRAFDGPLLSPWFGAVADSSTNNTVALQTMLNLLIILGGTARFEADGVGIYRTNRLIIQGPLTKPISIESDPHVWLERHSNAVGGDNLLDIYDCEDGCCIGNLNLDCRYSVLGDGGIDAGGHGITIRDCSHIKHTGSLRVRDWFGNAVLVYTLLEPDDPPRFHDVTFDYVEMIAPYTTDAAGHVTGGGLATNGILFEDMYNSGARFVYAEGILTGTPGIAIQFKNHCRECWYGGYAVKQCFAAIATGGDSPTFPKAQHCWFGPGTAEQVRVALLLNDSEHITVAHQKARLHPDGPPPMTGSYFRFVHLSGPANDCSITVEIIDWVNTWPDPPIYMPPINRRNRICVPWINGNPAVYVENAGEHNSIIIEHDVALTGAANLGAKFVDTSGTDLNNYAVAGPGFAWRQGPVGGFRLDNNDLSVRDIGGAPGMSGGGYLGMTAEHYQVGVAVLIPTNGFALSCPAHTGICVLEPAGPLATGSVGLPSSPADGQQQTIVSTETITTLTLNAAGGHTIKGGVSTLTANTPVSYVFHEDTLTWYRA